MKLLSQILSALLSPLLVPTYGVVLSLFLTVLSTVPAPVKWTVTGVCFAITCLVPLLAIIVLHRIGLVKDPGLNNRNERLIPYAVSALSYGACAAYLHTAHAPSWLWLFMAGAGVATVVCAAVNFRWKISAHLTAMGGLTAIAFRILDMHIAAPGVNFILAVKENQKNMYREISEYFEDGELHQEIKDNGGYKMTVEKAHSQMEKREYYQSGKIG